MFVFGIFSLIMEIIRLGPRHVYQQRLKTPVIQFIDTTLDIFKSKAEVGLYNTRDVLLKGGIVAFITSSIVWLSIFMYLVFYYAYVPSIAHERNVHLQFSLSHDDLRDSYLTAHIELTKRQQLLMLGQPYKIFIDLEMPESQQNKDLGMFMICAEFHGKDRTVISQSCRSSMLHYKSPLLEIIHTIFYSPLYLFGAAEQKQHLHIELYSKYEEHGGSSVTDVYIEIQSKQLQLYSAKFLINAEFGGLRYLMFNWPILSAVLGVSLNLFFIAIICFITWHRWINSDEYKKYIERKKELQSRVSKIEDDSYSSSSIEDISMLEKFRERSSESDIIEDLTSTKND